MPFRHLIATGLALVACSASAQDNCRSLFDLEQRAPSAPETTDLPTDARHAHALGSTLDMGLARQFIEKLSGEKPLKDGTHLTDRGTPQGRAKTRRLLTEIIRDLGYSPTYEVFKDTFDGRRKGINMLVEIPGRTHPEEVVEITSHLDSFWNPGADDNGSATAMMLALLQRMKTASPGRTLRFVFMDLEEQGFQGSRAHVESIQRDPRRFIGAMVVDTIGWALDGGETYVGVMEIGIRPDHGGTSYQKTKELARDLFYSRQRVGNRQGLVISPEREDAMPKTADHGSYWEADLPAVLIAAPFSAGYVNPNYHRQTDRIENMNWHYYRLMAQQTAEMFAFVGRVRLNNPNEISQRAWDLITQSENQIDIQFKELVPAKPVDRERGLPPGYVPPPLED